MSCCTQYIIISLRSKYPMIMPGAWSYSKYPLLKSKQEMEAGKDHIGTRQDPAALGGPNRQRRE